MTLFQKMKNNNSSRPEKSRFFISRLLDIILLILNIFLVISLFLGELSCLISPETITLPIYFGMAYPVIVILNFLFMIFWIARLRWIFIISLLAIIICHQNILTTFPLNKKKEIPENTITILSYNVHLFDFYTPKSKNQILNYISNCDADILCIQEFGFSTLANNTHLKKADILESLNKRFPYNHINLTQINKRSYGFATFSNYPIFERNAVD